jgi:outer membrane protein assembly factor BamB
MLSGEPEIFRYRDGTLYSIGALVEAVNPVAEEKTWETELDITDSWLINSTAITASTLYIGGETAVYALARETGEIQWTFEIDGIEREHPGVRGLAATRDRVFVGMSAGQTDTTVSRFYSLDATDGTQQFKQRFDGDHLDAIVTHDDLVYLGVANRSLGYDPSEKAVFSTLDRFDINVGGEMTVDGDRLLLRDGGLQAHDLDQKSNIFSVDIPDFAYTPPVMLDKTVISGGETGIYGHAFPSGEQDWHVRTTGTIRTPIGTYESIVLTADGEGILYGVDVSNGELLYDTKPTGNRLSALAVVEDTLLLGDDGVQAYDIQTE